jgi:hypothetical protein
MYEFLPKLVLALVYSLANFQLKWSRLEFYYLLRILQISLLFKDGGIGFAFRWCGNY